MEADVLAWWDQNHGAARLLSARGSYEGIFFGTQGIIFTSAPWLSAHSEDISRKTAG